MEQTSLKRLTCSTFTAGASSVFDNEHEVAGRVLLRFVWPIVGFQGSAQFGVKPLIFRDGDSSGEILLKVDYQTSGHGQAFNLYSLGEGGILFPNGLHLTLSSTDTQKFAGCTILYELG